MKWADDCRGLHLNCLSRRTFLRCALVGSGGALLAQNVPVKITPPPPAPPKAKAYRGILRHALIFHDAYGYSAWPSILRCKNGELLIAFCEAMRRKARITHADPSFLGLILRSRDGGETWSEQPEVIGDYSYYGMDDPGIMQLSSGRILANAFRRAYAPAAAAEQRADIRFQPVKPFEWAGGYSDQMTYVFHSLDNARTWLDPAHVNIAPFRSACQLRPIIELKDGTLLLPCYEEIFGPSLTDPEKSSTWTAFCCRSRDAGRNWGEATLIAPHREIGFNEPSMIQLPSGKIVTLMRTAPAGWLYQSDSQDGGRTWSAPVKTPLFGHPADLRLLQDGRLLATYGHRRPPYGIRACVSADEARTWDMKNEIVLRDDFKNGDLGYPTTTQLSDGTLLTAYYGRDENNDVTCIQGTFWKLV